MIHVMRTSRFRRTVVATAAVALLGLPASAVASHTVVRATSNDTWAESYNHIRPGSRVVWKNPAALGDTHDLTAYGSNWNKSVTLQAGDQTAKTFRRTGTYRYRCRLHSTKRPGEQCRGMCGVIHVARY